MEGLYVAGRWFREPLVKIMANASGVVIRVDDKRNAEAWFEIGLDQETLEELLTKVENHQDHNDEDRT